jgi:peptide/nickel transport system permease protein
MKIKLSGQQKKFLSSILTIFVATIFSFILIRLMPGDFIHLRATEIVQQQNIPYETAYAIAKTQFNYDPGVPIYKQFFIYIGGLLTGNFGVSMTLRIPVSSIIFRALPWTLFLCSFSLLASFLIGSTFGLIMSWKRRSKILESMMNLFSVITQAVPDFLIGLLLLVVFAVRLRWFPLRGAYDMSITPGFSFEFIGSVFYHAALPILAFTISTMGGWALSMRASATSVLSEDYINVAKAKGLKERRIFSRYLGKNAFIPILPGLAISFGYMISGSMFIEWMFSYPGIGYFFGYSIGTRDYTLLQGILFLSTVTIVMINYLSDYIYALIDPRVKLN